MTTTTNNTEELLQKIERLEHKVSYFKEAFVTADNGKMQYEEALKDIARASNQTHIVKYAERVIKQNK